MTTTSAETFRRSTGPAPSSDGRPRWVRFTDALERTNLLRLGIDELMALDDRMLAGIGLVRGDVEHAARYR
jgi:hypothetical protein